MSDEPQATATGMSPALARAIERTIIVLSVASLVLIFQPFSLTLYSIGAGLVVLAGLLFNLVPLCTPGRPLRSLITAVPVIAAIFIVVVLLGLGSAELYSWYVRSSG